jgi:hypothetical protein
MRLRRIFINQVIWTATAMDMDRFHFLESLSVMLTVPRLFSKCDLKDTLMTTMGWDFPSLS